MKLSDKTKNNIKIILIAIFGAFIMIFSSLFVAMNWEGIWVPIGIIQSIVGSIALVYHLTIRTIKI